MTRKPLITPAWEWACIIGAAVILGCAFGTAIAALSHVLAWVLA